MFKQIWNAKNTGKISLILWLTIFQNCTENEDRLSKTYTQRWNMKQNSDKKIISDSVYILKTARKIYAKTGKIYTKKSISSLDAPSLEIEYISTEIGQCKNLVLVLLKKNKIKNLPKEIGNLKKMRILDLQHNEINELPKEIGSLDNLVSLYLGCNKLETLPKEIGYLGNLRSLWLDSNKITHLPDEIKRLTSLIGLGLRGNPISENEKERIKKLLPHTKIIF